MPLPTNVSTGTVYGLFPLPDGSAAQGAIRFAPGVQYLPDPTAEPWPATILNEAVTGILDIEGYLCRLDAEGQPGARGVPLIAGDDPDLSVQGWTWTAHYEFTNTTIKIPSHAFFMPTDGELDLTTIVKVPSSTGVGTDQAAALTATATAAVLQALAYTQDAAASADAAEAVMESATSSATASKVVIRDSNARAKFADPAAASDAATKGYTDTAVATRAPLVHTHLATDISDSTAVGRAVVKATDAAAARTAIGAGTSNLAIGTTSTTAMAGDRTFTKTDVGLANVDNTADDAKPISALTATALAGKSDTGHTHSNATSGAVGFMSSTDKSKLDASTSTVTNSALVQRSSGGFVEVKDPTSGTHGANKTYVDAQVATRAPVKVDTGWLSTTVAITPATNWAVTSYKVRKIDNSLWAEVVLTYSGSTVTVGADGNITDLLAATMPAGWYPTAAAADASISQAGTAQWFGTIATDGKLTITHGIPALQLVTATAVTFRYRALTD